MIEYSPDQQSAMRALKSGQNVFLTGKAGTGKTTILNRFIEWAIENKNINGLLDYKDLRTSAKVRKFYGGI